MGNPKRTLLRVASMAVAVLALTATLSSCIIGRPWHHRGYHHYHYSGYQHERFDNRQVRPHMGGGDW